VVSGPVGQLGGNVWAVCLVDGTATQERAGSLGGTEMMLCGGAVLCAAASACASGGQPPVLRIATMSMSPSTFPHYGGTVGATYVQTGPLGRVSTRWVLRLWWPRLRAGEAPSE
jgi:hypothetical protein